MKTNFYTKGIAVGLFLVLLVTGNLFAGMNIVFVYTPTTVDSETGENPDLKTVAILEEAGYEITLFDIIDITTASDEQMETLNTADLVYIGRAVGSTNFQDPKKQIWNSIEAPIMTGNMWALRNTRMNWFNSADCVGGGEFGSEDVVEVEVLEGDDPVFANIDLSSGWWIGAYNTIEAEDGGNGTVMLAEITSGNYRPVFVRFEAGVEFYDGAVDEPAGPRTFMGMDCDASGATPFNYSAYTDEAMKVFLNEVAYLTGNLEDNTGIFNNRNLFDASVYPTMVKNTITVEMQGLNKIEIVSLDGRILNSTVVNSNKATVETTGINAGLYLVKLTNSDNISVSKRIIKE
ncbi:MAG: T9SS type A sorting domain-containing protein [Prolixibacteraceae bacterium]